MEKRKMLSATSHSSGASASIQSPLHFPGKNLVPCSPPELEMLCGLNSSIFCGQMEQSGGVTIEKPVRGVNESQHASFSVKPARKMISNIDYPIISHLSNMPTFFWAKTRQIRGADTPRGRNVPGKEAGQRQTKWHTVWCAISICHTWPRR